MGLDTIVLGVRCKHLDNERQALIQENVLGSKIDRLNLLQLYPHNLKPTNLALCFFQVGLCV